jgi:hypothetical protein
VTAGKWNVLLLQRSQAEEHVNLTGDAKMHEMLRGHDGAFHDAFRCNKQAFQALLKLERLNGCGQPAFPRTKK